VHHNNFIARWWRHQQWLVSSCTIQWARARRWLLPTALQLVNNYRDVVAQSYKASDAWANAYGRHHFQVLSAQLTVLTADIEGDTVESRLTIHGLVGLTMSNLSVISVGRHNVEFRPTLELVDGQCGAGCYCDRHQLSRFSLDIPIFNKSVLETNTFVRGQCGVVTAGKATKMWRH